MLISIIVPCYNEQETLKVFYEEIRKVINSLSQYNFELLFIDDGSSDKTYEIISGFAKKDLRVRYISFSRNFGKEAAIYAGFSKANGDLVAVMDADMQDPPDLLPNMINILINQDYDSVATRRISRKGEPPIRSFFAHMFYKMINRMSNLDIVDGARDYRLMTRKVVDSILALKEYHRFSKGIFGWVGFKTKWIEYENIQRIAGETKWSFWKLFRYAIEGIVAFTTIPLRIATFLGFGVSTASFIYLCYLIIKTVVKGVDIPGYASMIVIVSFIGGVELLAIGILGEYLSRTYMEVKSRPIFLIKETNISEVKQKNIANL